MSASHYSSDVFPPERSDKEISENVDELRNQILSHQEQFQRQRQRERAELFIAKQYLPWNEFKEFKKNEEKKKMTRFSKIIPSDFFENVHLENSSSSEDNFLIRAKEKSKTKKQRELEHYEKLLSFQRFINRQEVDFNKLQIFTEIKNPTIFGWYFGDGYYETLYPFFGVNDEWVERLRNQQQQFRNKMAAKRKMTFTEKFKTHFWPPKKCCKGILFRTKGTYMDFPEVQKDPPATVKANFEKETHEVLSNKLDFFKSDSYENDDVFLEPDLFEHYQVEETTHKTVVKHKTKPKFDDYYFEESLGQFVLKVPADAEYYYFDGYCWLKAPEECDNRDRSSPYDYCFDDEINYMFIAKADITSENVKEMYFDHEDFIYKFRRQTDEFSIRSDVSRSAVGLQATASNVSGKKEANDVRKPKDFHFDEEIGKWVLSKTAPKSIQGKITWDKYGHRYAFMCEGEWRGLSGLSPDDFYFDFAGGIFNQKCIAAQEGKDFKYDPTHGVWMIRDDDSKSDVEPWVKPMLAPVNVPEDYYFSNLEGRFLLREKNQDHKYYYQRYTKIYRMKRIPRSGLYPRDFYWDSKKEQWIPKACNFFRQYVSLSWITGKRPGAATNHLGQLLKAEDYYWDTEDGLFLRKRSNDSYYKDSVDGIWKSQKNRDKVRNRKYPGDYFYDGLKQKFEPKEPSNLTNYEFDSKNLVWKLKETDASGSNSFAFDETSQAWTKAENMKKDPICRFNIIRVSTDKASIPDDYWFDFNEDRYCTKIPEDQDLAYNENIGVWYKTSMLQKINKEALWKFYFDDDAGKFRIKISNLNQDYWWDSFNLVYRHITAQGKNRSGFKPDDYEWKPAIRNYVLKIKPSRDFASKMSISNQETAVCSAKPTGERSKYRKDNINIRGRRLTYDNGRFYISMNADDQPEIPSFFKATRKRLKEQS